MREREHPYCYPGTDVLRNREDIRDRDDLEEYERIQALRRTLTLPRDLPISVEGYREIHRYMLQDVYDWAGEYRTVDTGRDTAPFCLAQFIDKEMESRFAAINEENNLRGLTPDRFAERAAEHVCELNAVHPFLDGNGRTQRAFLEILGKQAAHEIDLARVEPDKWNEASAESFRHGDYSLMREIIADTIRERPPREQDRSDSDLESDASHADAPASRDRPEREKTDEALESTEKQQLREAKRKEGLAYYLAKREFDRENEGGDRGL